MENAIIGIGIGIVVSILGMAVKGLFQSKPDAQHDQLTKLEITVNRHIESCDEIPKSTILEKIKGVSDQMATNASISRDRMDALKQQFDSHASQDRDTAKEIFGEMRRQSMSIESLNINTQLLIKELLGK